VIEEGSKPQARPWWGEIQVALIALLSMTLKEPAIEHNPFVINGEDVH